MSASDPASQPTGTGRFYETLYDLNRGFALTLECFERLERLAFFPADQRKSVESVLSGGKVLSLPRGFVREEAGTPTSCGLTQLQPAGIMIANKKRIYRKPATETTYG